MLKSDSILKNFLKQMDFFSVTFQFRVDNKKKYTTLCGGLCFLFYLLCIISYILKSFFDYITFTDFKILFIDRFEDQTTIDINDDRFFYSFKFTYEEVNSTSSNSDLNNDVLVSKYKDLFILDHNYVLKNIETGISNKTKTPFTKCDIEHIKRFDKSIPDKTNFSSFYNNHICFKYKNYSIYGLYTDKIMSYIEVSLRLNKTYYHKNLDTLKDIFSKVNFKFNPYYSDYIYDVSNLTNPILKRIESTLYSYIDINYYERTNIFLNELIYVQDQNLFFKENKNETYIKYSNYDKSLYPILGRFDKNMIYSDKYNLIKYFIRPNMKKSVIRMALIKIPEFFSGISAISTSSLILFNIVVSYFNSFKAKQKIIQKIMKYNDIVKDDNKDYFEYFMKNIKEKMPNMNENLIKNQNKIKSNRNKNYEKRNNNKIKSFDNKVIMENEKIDSKRKNRKCDELKIKNNKFLLYSLKSDPIDASLNSQSRDLTDNSQINITRDKNLKVVEIKGVKLNSSRNLIIENDVNDPIKDFKFENFDCIQKYSKQLIELQERKIKRNSDRVLPILSQKCMDSIMIDNIHSDKTNNPIILRQSDKENVHTKLGCSEANINLALLKENSNYVTVDDVKKKENLGILNIEKINLSKDLTNNHLFERSRKDNIVFDAFGKKIIQNFNKKSNTKSKNPLKITCLELFFNRLICKKEIKQKKMIFDIAEKKFNYNLDILTYLKRMLEIDIMKYLILDKNLLNIMNFLSKPSVSYKMNEKEYQSEFNFFFNDQTPEKEINMVAVKDSFDNIFKPYNDNKHNLKNDNNFSNTEEKMLKLFKHQIEEIIK